MSETPPPLPVAITLTPNTVGSSITLNGMDISRYVRGIQVEADAHRGTRVSLDLINVDVALSGAIDPRILQRLVTDPERIDVTPLGASTFVWPVSEP